jgi:hypothetical protein
MEPADEVLYVLDLLYFLMHNFQNRTHPLPEQPKELEGTVDVEMVRSTSSSLSH